MKTYGQIITEIMIALTALWIAGYDIAAWLIFGVQDTITDVTRRWAAVFPYLIALIALAMGALFGHFFLQTKAWQGPMFLGFILFPIGMLIGQYLLK